MWSPERVMIQSPLPALKSNPRFLKYGRISARACSASFSISARNAA